MRLSNLIESVPQLRNPVTRYLQANEDDDELAGRLKNVLEGLGAGAMVEGFLTVLKGTRAMMRGNKAAAQAAADELETLVATGATAQRAAQSANAEAAARRAVQPETPSRGTIASIVEGVRQRLGH